MFISSHERSVVGIDGMTDCGGGSAPVILSRRSWAYFRVVRVDESFLFCDESTPGRALPLLSLKSATNQEIRKSANCVMGVKSTACQARLHRAEETLPG